MSGKNEGQLTDAPVLLVKSELYAHAPFQIQVNPSAFSDPEMLALVSALLPNIRHDEVYATLAAMGRERFEKYFTVISGQDAVGQGLDADELWDRIERLQEGGLL